MTNADTDIYSPAFFMADHAAVESGKVYANGAFWNRMQFPGFPAVTHFGVVAVLNIPWRAYHQPHKFAVWFEDADGGRVAGELGGEFTVGTTPDMKVGDETVMPIAAMVNNFTLTKAGDYSAVLAVDGQEISRWTFKAVLLPAGMQPNRPVSPSDLPAGF
ncbi:MAG: hypothetical protein JWN80_2275 [Microbacteriaceae bacterium]|nr:hypothetical protein [Microbacteriaceae bacterium]